MLRYLIDALKKLSKFSGAVTVESTKKIFYFSFANNSLGELFPDKVIDSVSICNFLWSAKGKENGELV